MMRLSRLIFTASLLFVTLLAKDLEIVVVKERQDDSLGVSKFDKSLIENSIQSNGFISSVLAGNSSVEVNDVSLNSSKAGEIKQGQISINKAPFYQNSFLIDNISNSSNLDPNSKSIFSPYGVAGNENEIFLDLDLIESLKLYSSNVSAKYGGFLGGVILAKTIRTRDKFTFKASYKHTSNHLTSLHSDNKQEFLKAKNDNNQPIFSKNFYSLHSNLPINSANSLLLSYNYKHSNIPADYFGKFENKIRKNESFFVKHSHFFDDDSVLDTSLLYSPYTSTHFIYNIKDSNTKLTGGGVALKSLLEKDLGNWNAEFSLGLKQSQNSKESKNYNKKWIKTKTKNWFSQEADYDYAIEGGSGSLEKSQTNFTLSLDLTRQMQGFYKAQHKLQTGLTLSLDLGRYKKDKDTNYYTNPKLNYLVDCMGDDESCVSNEQYFTSKKIYKKEDTKVDMTSLGAYFQDDISVKNIDLNLGLRLDYNSFLKNLDLSPRFGASALFFDTSLLFVGLNRYYGKSFLGHKLRSAQTPYYEEYQSTKLNRLTSWQSSADKDVQKYQFTGLKTPFSDEFSIGLNQKIATLSADFKYLIRTSKNQFSKHNQDYKIFTMPNGLKGYYKPTFFGNKAHSDLKTFSVDLHPNSKLRLGIFDFYYSFATSFSHYKANFDSYDDVLDTNQDEIQKVFFDGKFYDKSALPQQSSPNTYVLRLNFISSYFKLFGKNFGLNLNSVLTHTGNYSKLEITDTSKKHIYKDQISPTQTKEYEVSEYKKINYTPKTSLDLSSQLKFKLGENKLSFNVEVINVFNTKQEDLQNMGYKIGRQIWLEASYAYN